MIVQQIEKKRERIGRQKRSTRLRNVKRKRASILWIGVREEHPRARKEKKSFLGRKRVAGDLKMNSNLHRMIGGGRKGDFGLRKKGSDGEEQKVEQMRKLGSGLLVYRHPSMVVWGTFLFSP